jgi:hypothetical protein
LRRSGCTEAKESRAHQGSAPQPARLTSLTMDRTSCGA